MSMPVTLLTPGAISLMILPYPAAISRTQSLFFRRLRTKSISLCRYSATRGSFVSYTWRSLSALSLSA